MSQPFFYSLRVVYGIILVPSTMFVCLFVCFGVFMNMCHAYVCACAWGEGYTPMCMQVHMYAPAVGALRSTHNVFLNCSLPYIFKTASLSEPEGH